MTFRRIRHSFFYKNRDGIYLQCPLKYKYHYLDGWQEREDKARAKESTKQELKEEVYKYFTGEDYEPYEMVYFKLYESQLPVVERALYVASRMVGTERSRGYCLELVCADFLAGRTEESTPEEILLVIHRLVTLLPPDHQARLSRQSETAELEPAEDAEEGEADQAGEADLPPADEASAGAGRLAMSEVRLDWRTCKSTTRSSGASRATMRFGIS